MKSRHRSFNIYFALGCLVLAGGCSAYRDVKEAVHPKKEKSTIRLYLEGQGSDKAISTPVLVTSNKFPYIIENEPFLTEADLANASIVNDPGGDGGFSIKLQFTDHGALVLDMYTASNKGKHIIVLSQFPTPGLKPKKAKKTSSDSNDEDLIDKSNASVPAGVEVLPSGASRQSGWLAAVLIRSRLSDGVFIFTPDASPKEGFRIVRGLRNVITKENKSQ